jgi:hypothetical protein
MERSDHQSHTRGRAANPNSKGRDMHIALMALLLLQASQPVLDNEFLQVFKNSAPCAAAGPGCGERILVALGAIELEGKKMVRGDLKVFQAGERYTPPTGGDFVEVTIKPGHPQPKAPSVSILSDKYKVLYESEHLLVAEEFFQPGDKSIRHSHNQRLSITLNATRNQGWTDGQLEPSPPRDLVPDTISFGGPTVHTVKNLGPNPIRNLMIELKP